MRQIDTIALIPTISKNRGWPLFTSSLEQSYDLHEIQLTLKEDLLEQKYVTGSIHLLTPNHNFMSCGGPEAFTSTTIFETFCGKTSS